MYDNKRNIVVVTLYVSVMELLEPNILDKEIRHLDWL